MEFKKCNMNPKDLKVGMDIISGENCDKELFEIGYKKCRMVNDKIVYEKWLQDHGWVKIKMPKKPNNKRYTLEEWINDNPDLTFVASVAKHLTFIDKGILIDTWNCSYKCLGNYWIKF